MNLKKRELNGVDGVVFWIIYSNGLNQTRVDKGI